MMQFGKGGDNPGRVLLRVYMCVSVYDHGTSSSFPEEQMDYTTQHKPGKESLVQLYVIFGELSHAEGPF